MSKAISLKGTSLYAKIEPIAKVIVVIVAIYVVLNILFFDNYSLTNYIKEKNRYAQTLTKHNNIIQTNHQLQTEIQRLKTDPFYIESIARKDYRMVKENESVYIFRQ